MSAYPNGGKPRASRRQLPDILSEEEIARLLAVPNTKTPTGLRDRVIMEVLYRSGLRISEALDLTTDRVRLDDGWILVRHGKRDKSRDIPISPSLRPWLEKWATARAEMLLRRGCDSEWYFCTTCAQGTAGTQPGQRCNRSHLWKALHRYGETVGLDVHCHSLRHLFCTNMLQKGFGVFELQQLMGHSNISSTLWYVHIKPAALAEKMQSIG